MSTIFMICVALVCLLVYLLYRVARWIGNNSGKMGRGLSNIMDDLGDIGDFGGGD